MSSLICGSLAYDTIADFPGRFAEHIIADKIHMLNVAFLVPTLRREFGGCAGNIAYALRQLGGEPVIVGALGSDGGPYAERLDALGIGREQILTKRDVHTAQCHITTDLDNNQITSFHPGAMNHAHEQSVPSLPRARLGIIAPDGRDAMLQHAQQMADAGLPFVFDPGQGLPMFDGAELERFVAQASWVVVNDYEAALLEQRCGRGVRELAAQLRGLVVTRGGEGCVVYEQDTVSTVPALRADQVIDPTGCGDAFRGGLLWALEQGWGLADACRLGNVIGARKIACAGPQNYTLDLAEALRQFSAHYGPHPAAA